MRFSILICTVLFCGYAQAQNFELVNGSADISGKPNISPEQARQNWQAACDSWKAETKELNKNDQVMMLSCETPSCNSYEGILTCSSTAKFTVKTAGTRVQNTPPPAPVATEEAVVATAPPPVIVETVPAPQAGFIWIGGYWGWRESRHYWYPGHWEQPRPGYVWVQPRWVPHARGWRFVPGRWHR